MNLLINTQVHTPKEESALSRPLPTLLPLPHSVQTDDGDVLLCRDGQPCCRIETAAFDHAVYTHACSLLTNCCPHADGGAYPVRVTADPAYPLLQEHQTADAYAIRVTDQAAELIGYDAGGVLYAVQTFMQLVQREGGDISLPCCTIIDWPPAGTAAGASSLTGWFPNSCTSRSGNTRS